MKKLKKGWKQTDLIQKGGEGSKGGKIIGHTKSGKPIYGTAFHSGHQDFTYYDHKDAALLHRRLGKVHDKKYHEMEPDKSHWNKSIEAHIEYDKAGGHSAQAAMHSAAMKHFSYNTAGNLKSHGDTKRANS